MDCIKLDTFKCHHLVQSKNSCFFVLTLWRTLILEQIPIPKLSLVPFGGLLYVDFFIEYLFISEGLAV